MFGHRDDNVIYIINELRLMEDVKTKNVLEPDVGDHIDVQLTDREVTTLTPMVNTLKS